MDQIIQWATSQTTTRLVFYYIGVAWLTAAYIYRSPTFGPVGVEVFYGCVFWPIYWFFRLATVGF